MEVKKVGVIGAGTMGSGIAISGLAAGRAVTLVDRQPAAVMAGRGTPGERIRQRLGEQAVVHA